MEGFNQVISEYPQLGIAGGVGATLCAAGALIYKIATRKKPTHIEVNCWFCDQDTVVPYGNRNCWDCPNCDQYNGFQENGHYNKPIPAQHLEHLNHGVSAGLTVPETPKVLQWVNCQMLLCKKCNNNQTLKIKQLASFVPREEEKYDEEIEVYKHHLEQTYKLCRPCQTAVEYYIKHQNRQLRAVLFNHRLRCSREADKACVQNSYTPNFSTPARVIFLRILAFLSCVFLVVLAVYGSEDPFTPASSLHSPPAQPVLNHSNASGSSDGNAGGGQGAPVWQELFSLVPQEAVENVKVAWDYGKSHQIAVVSLGLFTCLMAVFLAGRIRLRRIDAVASVLWLAVLGLHLVENYLKTDVPSWLDAAKFGTTSLCCLVGFTAAVATRKSSGQRRYRARRYLSGDSATSFYSGDPGVLSPALSASSVFLPTPPPILSHLVNHQLCHRVRKASPSSLPGRLNRALSLGTIPSISRADSGYLFSGSRPSSQISNCKDSPPSDYFSLKSGSRPSSPGPSPTPSIAGSVTSTSSSARGRRPLISPARLNLKGQRLQLFTSHSEALPSPTASDDTSNTRGPVFTPELSALPAHNHDAKSILEGGSVFDELDEKRGSSSGSSTCLVDTTTGDCPDSGKGLKGLLGNSMLQGLLCLSLMVNIIYTSVYLYQSLR
ncbi:transmembrane protein 201-like [Acipenser oxyrinchus oxyrinchus]|uniref:Transmembrane protein 201-like n=1 Tax=Acipenser oxyrinchus oxyrinchus TaxID=40147 RepID=A0AAD8CED0_ACIOX|nr:transmembrane protein 201-like [Acipenser oxyrinchus oxyrinchus]